MEWLDVVYRGVPESRAGLQLASGSRSLQRQQLCLREPGRSQSQPRGSRRAAECRLDTARDKAIGPLNDVHADRRPGLYRGIAQEAVPEQTRSPG